MLAKSLDSLLLKVVLNSTAVRDRLIEHLLSFSPIFSDSMLVEVIDELRRNGDNCWRSNEYEQLAGFDFNSPEPLQKWLRTLFSRYFQQDGISLHARNECLEEYGAICRDCHPFLLISAGLGEQLQTGNLSPHNAELISESLTENALFHRHDCDYAENHCHYGGADNNNESLFALLYDQPCKGSLPHSFRNDHQRMKLSAERDLFRLTFGHLSDMLLGEKSDPELFRQQLQYIWDGQLPLSKSTSTDLRWLQEFCGFLTPDSPSKEVLFRMARQLRRGYLDSALLLFMIAAQSGCLNAFGMQLFWLFSLQLNRFRSGMVMSHGNGLSDFVRYYGSSLRKAGSHHHDAIRSIFMGGTTHLELRQAQIPDKKALSRILCESGKTLRKRHPEYRLLHTNELWGEFPHPAQEFLKFNFGYHFVKNSNVRSGSGEGRYQKKYRELEKKTRDLLDFFRRHSNRIAMVRLIPDKFCHVYQTAEGYELDMRLLLRTLDAAGDENLFPPEIFAPFARQIRTNSTDMQCFGQNKKMRRLRFAFHAGEDFAHIVTGMRRVDETVRFMEYESGDRLGHALAIGIDPTAWMHKKREILVPRLEHFDNCVWLWKMSIDMAPFYPEATIWTEFYAQQARMHQHKLYPHNVRADLNDFWQAFLLRGKHPDRLKIVEQDGRAKNEEVRYLDDERNEVRTCSRTVWDLHLKYLRLRSPEWGEERTQKEKPLHFRDEHFFATGEISSERTVISEKETHFWRAVQDYLLRQCEMQGFILEANPSSNVYISDLERYEEHPLFRWHPVRSTLLEPGGEHNRFGLRKGPVQVCVNSDDPGIFSTSLQNEFRLLQSVAQRKFTHDEAACWIEKLRQNGIRIFEENYISPYHFCN